jgi:hypothetical protein
MSIVQQAVFLCRNESFHQWLEKRLPFAVSGEITEERARKVICKLCGIQSRSELATNVKASALFEKLLREFQMREELPDVHDA